tara:strand:+ start:504 stop:746 length:243 start_codon:yes stop_codon:yes gene_type:complete
MHRDPKALAMFTTLIEAESDRLDVPLDSDTLADACYERMFEVLQQEAFEAVDAVREARESLPPWNDYDIPSRAELAGSCK